MQKYKSNLTSVSGAAVRGASITVLDESGDIASIFLDRAGTLPAGNPLKTGQDGTFEFYAANGRYSLRTDSSGLNVLEEDVILMFDPDDATVSGPIADAIQNAMDAAEQAQESAEQAQESADQANQLRVDLAAAGGAALVNGDYVTVQRTLDGIKNDFDLSWLITKDGNKVVVTGDSLSFNVYDFAGGSPDNEAESCWPGLMSWSFMLRDMIHRADPWFVHADMLDFTEFNGYGFNVWNQASAYLLPFNNRYVAIGGNSATSEVSFLMPSENQQTGKLVLHCANNPNSDNGLMDVYYSLHPYASKTLAGTLASGGRTKYQGWQPFQFDIPCGNSTAYPVKVIFTNFRNSDGSAASGHRRLFLQGVGTKNTPVYLTGHGGWKASDIYADFNNRIGQYAPDLLVIIIGTNDRFYTTKEDYATNLVNIINATKLIKPYCKIVVLTALRASDPGYAPDEVLHGSTMREFLGFAKSAVLDAGGIWFDSYAFTSGINPAVWRFDNVHMTKRGNKMLFDALVGHFFNAAPKNLQYYDPLLQSTLSDQIVFKDGLPSLHGVVQVTYDNANTRYNITGGSDKSIVVRDVTRVNAYTVRFTFNYNIFAQFAHDSRITPPTLVHTGSSSLAVMPRINTITSNSVDLYLIDVISGAVLTDAQNDGQVYSLLF